MYLVKGTGRVATTHSVARLRDRLPVRVDGVHLVLEPRVLDGLVVRERGRGLRIKLWRGGSWRLEAVQSPKASS